MYHPKNWPWVCPKAAPILVRQPDGSLAQVQTLPFFHHFPRVSPPGFPYFFDSFCMSHVRKILIPGHFLFFLLIYFGNMYFENVLHG